MLSCGKGSPENVSCMYKKRILILPVSALKRFIDGKRYDRIWNSTVPERYRSTYFIIRSGQETELHRFIFSYFQRRYYKTDEWVSQVDVFDG